MSELLQIELAFREGTSDKVYRAAIEKGDGGFLVNFAYGRRGATLTTGTKTQAPVDYEKAVKLYTKLIQVKTGKGYRPAEGTELEGGLGSSVTDLDQRDTGMRAQLLNPISEEDAEQYLGDPDWGMQEKFDGKRMQFKKVGDLVIAANKLGLQVGYPTVLARQLEKIPVDFEIDGECIGEKLYLYGLQSYDGVDYRKSDYAARYNTLARRFSGVGDNITVASLRTTVKSKKEFFVMLRVADKEGAVFKRLSAPWSAGRPNSGGNALKCKFWESCSCVVSKVNNKRSIAVMLLSNGTLSADEIPMGNVTIPPNKEIPTRGQIVEVKYLYVAGKGGSLYQPIYLGVRDDVQLSECALKNQKLKYKS